MGAQRLADMLAFNITLAVVAFGDPIDGAANVTERGVAAFAKALTVRFANRDRLIDHACCNVSATPH